MGCGTEVGSFLLHEGDVFVVDVAAMFDGVDSCLGGEEDTLCAVGVRGDLAAKTVRVGNDGLHLFEGVLRGLRIVSLGEYAAGGADFDKVRSILNVFANLMLDGRDTVSYSLAVHVILKREKIFVHVTAGDAEGGTGDLHMGAGNVAGIDLVA